MITQQRNKNGNWICADCGCETLKGYQSGNVVICGDCKQDALSPPVDDAKLDDPRRGQGEWINDRIRRPRNE